MKLSIWVPRTISQNLFIIIFVFLILMIHLRFFQGLFLIPELRDYSGFYLLQHQTSTQVEQLVAEATSKNRSRKMVTIFDELSDCLCRVADMVSTMTRGGD
jgi:hypothetical protein